MDDIEKLPDGFYWDDDEMLRDAEGNLMPDGVYSDKDGNVIMYEGNFLNMPLE
ncbi:hypothetical protein [Gordonibacter massiliensis (ex Traore et al. 2017)]|uniref:hypothetical protein n=1 Tax=Gordonibacter massiliensis (ex Traore et al. 2017) TaxID=1841863 RepID=UPI001C8B748E|nr:hypothetical protein [Gordonibacter massiliensis (ex Traore et al. 2017)]MBX9035044.1 hypothetical protein [Gordonibacter massiliensis (ex Traore et al. 2017)]